MFMKVKIQLFAKTGWFGYCSNINLSVCRGKKLCIFSFQNIKGFVGVLLWIDLSTISGWNVSLVTSLLRFILIWSNLWDSLDVAVESTPFSIRTNRSSIFKSYSGKLKSFSSGTSVFSSVEWFKISPFCKRLLKFSSSCLKQRKFYHKHHKAQFS